MQIIQIPDDVPMITICEFAQKVGCRPEIDGDKTGWKFVPEPRAQARIAVKRRLQLVAVDGQEVRGPAV